METRIFFPFFLFFFLPFFLSFFLSFSLQSEELFDFKEVKGRTMGKTTLLFNLVGEERMSLLSSLIVLRRNIQSEDGKIAHAFCLYKVLSEVDRKLSKLSNFIARLLMKRVKIYTLFSITRGNSFSKIDHFSTVDLYISLSLYLSFLFLRTRNSEII